MGSEMALFPISSNTYKSKLCWAGSLFATFGMRPNFLLYPILVQPIKTPLAWGLRSCSFPDRAHKQLTTGWVVRRSTWNPLGCYHRKFWVENAKGTVERRKYVLVDQWEHYLVWFVFCFPLAVGEECKQSLLKLMSIWIKPEDLSVRPCVRRMIWVSSQSLFYCFSPRSTTSLFGRN